MKGPNRYALLGRLATGGMAELFLARSVTDRDVVVLKRVKPARVDDPKYVSMFLDEARLVAQLRHENIARVLDIGRLGSSYFFTMEYVHGADLRAVMSRMTELVRVMPIGHALHIAAATGAGLHHAHQRRDAGGRPLGIVHRDVSPANVMVGFDGSIKVIDFGIAKATTVRDKTKTGAVKGKVTYFSPEQCRGTKGIDRRSDVFSLGIVLHEMLTGRRLFKRKNDYETMKAILADGVPPPSTVRHDISAAIDGIVMTALARDPNARFATAGEMSEAIATVAVRDGLALSAGALGSLLRDLFGDPVAPAAALAGEQASLVTVTSIMAEIEAGAGADAGIAFADTTIEADLEHIPDTIVQPMREAGSADDEWRDEEVVRGGLRDGAPAIDPVAVIAEVRAAADSRESVERTFDDAPHEARTVAAAPPPSITDPELDIGDRRVVLVVPAVRRNYIARLAAIIVVIVVAIVVVVIAATR